LAEKETSAHKIKGTDQPRKERITSDFERHPLCSYLNPDRADKFISYKNPGVKNF
jgi:hypothetical protein